MLKSIELFYVTWYGVNEGDWLMMLFMTVTFAVIFYVCWHIWVWIAGVVFGKRLAKPVVISGLLFLVGLISMAYL